MMQAKFRGALALGCTSIVIVIVIAGTGTGTGTGEIWKCCWQSPVTSFFQVAIIQKAATAGCFAGGGDIVGVCCVSHCQKAHLGISQEVPCRF